MGHSGAHGGIFAGLRVVAKNACKNRIDVFSMIIEVEIVVDRLPRPSAATTCSSASSSSRKSVRSSQTFKALRWTIA